MTVYVLLACLPARRHHMQASSIPTSVQILCLLHRSSSRAADVGARFALQVIDDGSPSIVHSPPPFPTASPVAATHHRRREARSWPATSDHELLPEESSLLSDELALNTNNSAMSQRLEKLPQQRQLRGPN
ncbi:uncharacterized protein HRG_08761 [Hirsutella rhossiliensis]|uniref:Uncharacterized protein n=1 Tax=Hirsutella rhossiliensis TaxID=111463 RepID=A0A9P8SH37_9HYPO|nr:uncharacterized protein HRG_08761 [Hirsutella rhossiliensis]KAH0960606.1 hypothetical protein HRG_08761 [Hirsutella rhossiliensis]